MLVPATGGFLPLRATDAGDSLTPRRTPTTRRLFAVCLCLLAVGLVACKGASKGSATPTSGPELFQSISLEELAAHGIIMTPADPASATVTQDQATTLAHDHFPGTVQETALVHLQIASSGVDTLAWVVSIPDYEPVADPSAGTPQPTPPPNSMFFLVFVDANTSQFINAVGGIR